MSIYSGQQPKQLYRSFFRYLRHIPDPHIWSILQPRVRQLIERSIQNLEHVPESESSSRAQLRAIRARKRVEDEVRKVHMAVGCYPHALRRLLGDCYGETGSVRWELINNIMTSHSPPIPMFGRPPIPACLLPLAPPPVIPPPARPRARTIIPDTAIRKAAQRSWTRQWTGVRVPLLVPGDGNPKTGWEGKGIIPNLRILAGLDSDKALRPDLMPARIRRIYPVKLKPGSIEQYQPPPPRATRQNPRTWSNPHRLTRRLLRRAYVRLWESLRWVRPRQGSDQWKVCSFEEIDEVRVEGSGKKSRKDRKKEGAQKRVIFPKGEDSDNHWL